MVQPISQKLACSFCLILPVSTYNYLTGATGGARRHRGSYDSGSLPSSSNIAEICTFYLRGKCNYANKCRRFHPDHIRPYLWQRKLGTDWVDYSVDCQTEIETSFCDPAKNDCFTNENKYESRYTQPVYDAEIASGYQLLAGRPPLVVN